MTTFLILAGWVMAAWMGVHWYLERERADDNAADAIMLRMQLRAAKSVIAEQDVTLSNANRYIAQISASQQMIEALETYADEHGYYYVEN